LNDCEFGVHTSGTKVEQLNLQQQYLVLYSFHALKIKFSSSLMEFGSVHCSNTLNWWRELSSY